MLFTGLSAFIADCITTEKSRQRKTFSFFSVIVTRLVPLNSTVPPVISAGGLSSCAIANSIVDLPQPDSPTTPTNSPARTSRSTPSTAPTGPRVDAYSTRRSRTSRMGALGTMPPDRPQRRIADFIERVVQKCECDAEQCYCEARRQRPHREAAE